MENTEEYRIPTSEEFVQDFKFEIRVEKKGERLGSFGIWDFSKDPSHREKSIVIEAKEDVWEEVKVWWNRGPKEFTTTLDGITYTGVDNPEFDKPSWATPKGIQENIDNGDIRVKI